MKIICTIEVDLDLLEQNPDSYELWDNIRTEVVNQIQGDISEATWWSLCGHPGIYHEYLQSETWKKKRRCVLEREKGKCYICGASEHLQVHHNNYDRVFKEMDCDLDCLCRSCHEKIHEIENQCNNTTTESEVTALFLNTFDVRHVIRGHIPHIAGMIRSTCKHIDWNSTNIAKALSDGIKRVLQKAQRIKLK